MDDRRGNAGNVVAAIASFIVPGLGQLSQGRSGPAAGFFVAALLLWFVTLGMLGWIVHIVAAFEAAVWGAKADEPDSSASQRKGRQCPKCGLVNLAHNTACVLCRTSLAILLAASLPASVPSPTPTPTGRPTIIFWWTPSPTPGAGGSGCSLQVGAARR